MAAYLVITYDVSDAERFAEYNPGSLKGIFGTIDAHGGAIIGAGPPDVVTGSAQSSAVLLQFPDADSAKAWLDDDAYAPMKAIRFDSTSNTSEYIVPGLG